MQIAPTDRGQDLNPVACDPETSPFQNFGNSAPRLEYAILFEDVHRQYIEMLVALGFRIPRRIWLILSGLGLGVVGLIFLLYHAGVSSPKLSLRVEDEIGPRGPFKWVFSNAMSAGDVGKPLDFFTRYFGEA